MIIGRPRHSAEYTAYLASPAWQQVRLQALQCARWRCEACGVPRAAVRWLEVNHKHYRTPFGREQWPRDLKVLCPACHRRADARRRRRTALGHLPPVVWFYALVAVALLASVLLEVLTRALEWLLRWMGLCWMGL